MSPPTVPNTNFRFVVWQLFVANRGRPVYRRYPGEKRGRKVSRGRFSWELGRRGVTPSVFLFSLLVFDRGSAEQSRKIEVSAAGQTH